jgi:hypothetical protein
VFGHRLQLPAVIEEPAPVRIKATGAWQPCAALAIEELDLDEPRADEILVPGRHGSSFVEHVTKPGEGFKTAAVRYASVGAGFRGPCGPRTVAEPATDGHGPAHGRARTGSRTTAERPRTGPVGAVIPTVIPVSRL